MLFGFYLSVSAKINFHLFEKKLGTGIKRNCSTRTAMNSGPEILLPSENTPLCFIDTLCAPGTEVHCLATKMARVKGGFSVRRHLLSQGKDVMFLYSLGVCSA